MFRYCSFFIKGIECSNKECLFLHKIADESDIIDRSDLSSNKNIFIQQHSYAIKIADVYNAENKKRLLSIKKTKTVFPSPDLIYRSIFVIENDPNYHKETNKSNGNGNANGNRNPRAKITNEEQEVTENSKESSALIGSNGNNNEGKEDDNANEDSRNKAHHLYMNKNSSRFDFIEKEREINNGDSVPFHIQRLINKKITMHRLIKYMKHHRDIDMLLQNEALSSEKNDEWLQFIKETNTLKPDTENKIEDDCIKDFENINSFIIDKCIGDNQ